MSISKVRTVPLSGQAVPEQEILLPVPRLSQLQALERQAGSIGMALDGWLLTLLKANVTHSRPSPPQARLVLRLDAGSHRLLCWHAGTLGFTLDGLVGRVLAAVEGVRPNRPRDLHADGREPAQVAHEVLTEGGC